MTDNRTLAGTLAALLLVALLLPACAVRMVDYSGREAMTEHTLPAEPGQNQWQTGDLAIQYTIPDSGTGFTLDGILGFDSYIRYSFPQVKQFRLTIHYLDADRRVIGSGDITPLIGYLSEAPERISLPTPPPAPAGTRFFTFSYRGYFTETISPDDNTGEWIISFTPFAR